MNQDQQALNTSKKSLKSSPKEQTQETATEELVFEPKSKDLMEMHFDDNVPDGPEDIMTTAEIDQFMSKLRRAGAQGIKAVEVSRKIIEHYMGREYKPLYFDMMNVRLYEKSRMEEAIALDERRVETVNFPQTGK